MLYPFRAKDASAEHSWQLHESRLSPILRRHWCRRHGHRPSLRSVCSFFRVCLLYCSFSVLCFLSRGLRQQRALQPAERAVEQESGNRPPERPSSRVRVDTERERKRKSGLKNKRSFDLSSRSLAVFFFLRSMPLGIASVALLASSPRYLRAELPRARYHITL